MIELYSDEAVRPEGRDASAVMSRSCAEASAAMRRSYAEASVAMRWSIVSVDEVTSARSAAYRVLRARVASKTSFSVFAHVCQ